MGIKRIFDFVVSLQLIIGLLPAIAVVALLVRWRLGSPVVFRAIRPGLNGKPFCMYKFRTMTNERDDEGRPLPDKDRVTPLGEILRRLSLDELPQLINVIKGDMSLVGPRPLAMEYLPLYNLEQVRRHHVKPGITGWAQVNGRSSISWTEKFKLDVWYVDHRSFSLDLRILFLTARNVVLQHGVCNTGETKYGNFSGSN